MKHKLEMSKNTLKYPCLRTERLITSRFPHVYTGYETHIHSFTYPTVSLCVCCGKPWFSLAS